MSVIQATVDSIPMITIVDDATRDSRYNVCKECSHFTATRTCSISGAVMAVNTVWADAECPEEYWAAESYGDSA